MTLDLQNMLDAAAGRAGLSTQAWVVKAMLDHVAAAGPAKLWYANHPRLRPLHEACELVRCGAVASARLTVRQCPTSVDAIASRSAGHGPRVAVIPAEDFERIAGVLREQSAAGVGDGLVVVTIESGRMRDAWEELSGRLSVAAAGRLRVVEPAWVRQVYPGLPAAVRLSRSEGVAVVMNLPSELADAWATQRVVCAVPVRAEARTPGAFAGGGSEELSGGIPGGSGGSGGSGGTSGGWNRLLHAPRRDEVSPLGLVGVGRACGPLWRLLQRLGVEDRLPVAMLHAVEPVDMGLIGKLAKHAQRLVVVEAGEPRVWRRVAAALPGMFAETESQACELESCVVGVEADAGELTISGLREHPAMSSEVLQARLREVLAPELPERTVTFDAAPRRAVLEHGSLWRDVLSVLVDLKQQMLDGSYMLAVHRRNVLNLDVLTRTKQEELLAGEPFGVLRMQRWSGEGWPLPGGHPGGHPGGNPGGRAGGRVVQSSGRTGGKDLRAEARTPRGGGASVGTSGGASGGASGGVSGGGGGNTSGGVSGGTSGGVSGGTSGGGTILLMDESEARRRCLQPLAETWTGQSLTVIVAREDAGGRGMRRRGRAALRLWRWLVREMGCNLPAEDVEVNRIDVTDRDRLRRMLERAVTSAGVHVVLVEKEELGRPKRKGVWQVDANVCELCLACTTRTGDPTLSLIETEFGQKIQTRWSQHPWDGVYQRLGACPAFERISVIRDARNLPAVATDKSHGAADELDKPRRPLHADAESWRCHFGLVTGAADEQLVAAVIEAGRRMKYEVTATWRRPWQGVRASAAAQVLFTRRQDGLDESDRSGMHDFRSDLTGGRIPPPAPGAPGSAEKSANFANHAAGGARDARSPQELPEASEDATVDAGAADVVAGLDMLEAIAAIDGGGRWRVCGPQTRVICDDELLPTSDQMLGRRRWSRDAARQALRGLVADERLTLTAAGRTADELLADRELTWAVMFGAMLQRGLVPVTLAAATAAVEVLGGESARTAFDVGRKLVDQKHPENAERPTHAPLRNRSEKKLPGVLPGALPGGELFQALRDGMRMLWTPEPLIDAAARRVEACLLWGGPAYAKRYVDEVLRIFALDDPQQRLAMTQAVVHNLGRVMLIKDEIYVAQLLTHPDKIRDDLRRRRLSRHRGERLVYERITRPELTLFGKRHTFEWRARTWQLRLLSKMQWLRRVVPHWHAREIAFRQWYFDLLRQVDWQSEAEYERWTAVLSLPGVTTGFRDVLWQKMAWAQRQAEQWLAMDEAEFVPPAWLGQTQPLLKFSLPVLPSVIDQPTVRDDAPQAP